MFHMKQLPTETLKKLNSYIDILMKWNEKINLTSYTRDELINIGIVDAFVASEVLKSLKVDEVLDLGTGYGMPGIVIKILCPPIKVALLDSSEKKIAFLEYVSKILKMPMDIYFKRLPDSKWGKRFSCIISKASMKEERLLDITSSIITPKGYLIYYSTTEPKTSEKDFMFKGAMYYKRIGKGSYIVVRQKSC
jgi:16S rRNA (guanine527-N7)-methyltransferase